MVLGLEPALELELVPALVLGPEPGLVLVLEPALEPELVAVVAVLAPDIP